MYIAVLGKGRANLKIIWSAAHRRTLDSDGLQDLRIDYENFKMVNKTLYYSIRGSFHMDFVNFALPQTLD